MVETLLTCPKCNVPLPEHVLASDQLEPCPTCRVPVHAEIYPAFFKPIERGSAGEAIVVEGEASCYYHPQKRAAIHCGSCGRFLCALCDVELNGEHICPACLESGQKKGKLTELENKRMLWDSAALWCAILPIFFGPLPFLTAPAAIILAIYAWNKPSSIVRQTRLRIYLAFVFSIIGVLSALFWVTTISRF
jgi:hypothetical protein